MTGSFKERGALNRLLTLTPDEGKRGVIAASAGNHGMAVAFHSHRSNISATIVMPLHAPLIKVTRVRQYGAQTVLHGADYDEAFAEAYRLAQERDSPSFTLRRPLDRRRPGNHRAGALRTKSGLGCDDRACGRWWSDCGHRISPKDPQTEDSGSGSKQKPSHP